MTDPSPAGPSGELLPRFEERWTAEYERAAGLKRLNPAWAKAEILLGLSAAVGGLKLLAGEDGTAWAGGALMVLGLYLAMAGNRSHLYQSLNRQVACLLHMAARAGQPGGDAER